MAPFGVIHVLVLCLAVFMQHFNISGCQKKKTISKSNGYENTSKERSTHLTTLMSVHRIVISIPLQFFFIRIPLLKKYRN